MNYNKSNGGKLITVKKIAEITGKTEKTVRQWIAQEKNVLTEEQKNLVKGHAKGYDLDCVLAILRSGKFSESIILLIKKELENKVQVPFVLNRDDFSKSEMCQNNLKIFNFERKQLRTVIINDKPYFCLKDVCNILDILNTTDTKNRLDKAGLVIIEGQNGRSNQGANFINEPNLYRVIFQSRKKEAKKFQNWVYEIVLPSIRETGEFSLKKNRLSKDEISRIVEKENFKNLMLSVQDSGENERMHNHGYSNYNNMIYKLVLGKNAKQFKKENQINNIANVNEETAKRISSRFQNNIIAINPGNKDRRKENFNKEDLF